MMTEAIGVATFSFELYPPRSEAADRDLAVSLHALAAAQPEFVSVTYGANGSSRGASLKVLRDLIELGVPPMAHLTCVGSTFAEETAIIRQFLDAGITRFLALRGDRPAGLPAGADFLGELRTAGELVQLIHNVQRERVPFSQVDVPGVPKAKRLRSGFDVTIAVAAFPTGHPHSRSMEQDIDTLLAKEAAGANLAITQLFFHADDLFRFVERARSAGVGLRILPGILPILSVRQLHRTAQLTGEDIPTDLLRTLESADGDAEQRARGIRFASDLARDVLTSGTTGLHLYTFNRHEAVLQVLDDCGLLAARQPAASTSQPASSSTRVDRPAPHSAPRYGPGARAGATVKENV
jgi:methylenetetrahydrofolate reductase (NADPH)